MSLIEKLYTLIIFLAIIIGISLGQVESIQANADRFIVPLLAAMLYMTFLQIPLKEVKKAFYHTRFTFTSVLINFIWTPALAWLLASAFLSGHPALYIGFIMLMVTPCTDWYLIFTGLAKGNVALSMAVLPLNFILQVILLPVYLFMFGGATGMIEFSFLMEDMLLVLGFPLVLAWMTQILLKNRQQIKDNLFSRFSVLPIVFLSLAIASMFASQGQQLLKNLNLLGEILVPVILFFIINFFVSQKIGQLMRFSTSDRVSLSLTTIARNSPIALAIAITAFPDQPLIALTLVIGPLLELPVLAVITQLLLLVKNDK